MNLVNQMITRFFYFRGKIKGKQLISFILFSSLLDFESCKNLYFLQFSKKAIETLTHKGFNFSVNSPLLYGKRFFVFFFVACTKIIQVMKKICLDCYTPEEFFKELIPLLQPLLAKQSVESSQSEVLTRKQAAKKLDITLSTLNTWTKLGLINSYRSGRRVYYKSEELIASLQKINHQKYKRKDS